MLFDMAVLLCLLYFRHLYAMSIYMVVLLCLLYIRHLYTMSIDMAVLICVLSHLFYCFVDMLSNLEIIYLCCCFLFW